jgi:hypothetical protein
MQRLVKALMLLAALFFVPAMTSAFERDDFSDDDEIGDFEDDDNLPSVPEPSGALVLGVALTTVALATRRKSK